MGCPYAPLQSLFESESSQAFAQPARFVQTPFNQRFKRQPSWIISSPQNCTTMQQPGYVSAHSTLGLYTRLSFQFQETRIRTAQYDLCISCIRYGSAEIEAATTLQCTAQVIIRTSRSTSSGRACHLVLCLTVLLLGFILAVRAGADAARFFLTALLCLGISGIAVGDGTLCQCAYPGRQRFSEGSDRHLASKQSLLRVWEHNISRL